MKKEGTEETVVLPGRKPRKPSLYILMVLTEAGTWQDTGEALPLDDAEKAMLSHATGETLALRRAERYVRRQRVKTCEYVEEVE
jgi:hypothetical protein